MRLVASSEEIIHLLVAMSKGVPSNNSRHGGSEKVTVKANIHYSMTKLVAIVSGLSQLRSHSQTRKV